MLTDNFVKNESLGVKIKLLIRKILGREKNKLATFAQKFYQYPSIKYLSKLEAVKHKFTESQLPSYLSAENFATTIINMLKERGAGTSVSEQIDYSFRFNTCQIQQETLKQLTNLYNDSGRDEFLFQKKLESWFDATMDRASGWYKRKIQWILFLVGFVIAIMFNVDSIAITRKLSADKTARDKVISMALQSRDSSQSSDYILNSKFYDSQPAKYKTLLAEADSANMVMGIGWDNLPDSEIRFWRFTLKAKLPYHALNPLGSNFWGLVITAIALSLGAPFWFDLLKKVVSIRGAGVKPEKKPVLEVEEKSTNFFRPSNDVLNEIYNPIIPDVAEEARKELQTIAGVWSVGLGYIKSGSEKIKAVEVNVQDISVQRNAENKLGKEFKSLPVNYIINKEPITNDLAGGAEVGNLTRINGFGVVSCLLRKNESDKIFFLSCWHVLKGDTIWRANTGKTELIANGNDDIIGYLVDGALTDNFDIGIGELSSPESYSDFNKSQNISRGWRMVTVSDAMNETEVFFVSKRSFKQSAVIYNDKVSKSILYADGNNYMLKDLFSIVRYKVDGTIVAPAENGDSGAVVVDGAGYPLGIVVASDSKFSYAVKFSNFMGENAPYSDYKVLIL
ncbi:hypothetical protein Solca_3414 [Sporocytophaga myxococcoides]|uniref:Uncharacterized protein n=2 Tax=Sporocytophaga myxococcoides TaxID=153721 RepID=A0A098LEF6_9BACT|nr:hypothetical protein Solca_3414 [Sporocytophaga myxococcoides]